MNVVIVIPTYNEKENIEPIIGDIFNATQGSQDQIEILVVDDNSPDGTGQIVDQIAKKDQRVHLLTGQKEGLGAAYVRGFTYAIGQLNADVVMEMDADGSHHPRYILPMLMAIHHGADVAVGTRYIKGGSIPSNWGLFRKFLSVFGNLVARVVLLTPQYHDMTTGFRATRTKALRKINLQGLHSKRFAYKIHLFHALHVEGANIVEVPFEFVDREKGYSKMPRNEVFDSLRVIFLIRIYESSTIIKFLIVGTIGFVVNAIALRLLNHTAIGLFLPPQHSTALSIIQIADVHLLWASVIAVEISIISNFLFHENWTYRKNPKKGMVLSRFLQFNLSSIVSPIISVTVINIMTPKFGIPDVVSLGIGTILGLVWNYAVNILWIWRPRSEEVIAT